jgi:flagellar basal-body rod modification protein FlgD
MSFNPATSATSGASGFNYAALGSDSSAISANKTQDAAATADRFLKLLVAQMKNQDPLNPMDNAQVTTQMAQINTVSGIEKLNTTVQGLSGQFSQLQTMQSAALVGRNVVVPGNQLVVDPSGAGVGAFELAGSADKVKVEVLNASGAVVDSIDMGRRAGGTFSFNSDAARSQSGPFTFRVTATNAEKPVSSTLLTQDRVQSVSLGGGAAGVQLQLQRGGTVAYADVRSLS